MKKMIRHSSFRAIFQGKSGRYYSVHEWNLGEIPPEEKAEQTDLVFDCNTKVVYYGIYDGKKLVSRMPYLSKNGKYCRFIENEIVEMK